MIILISTFLVIVMDQVSKFILPNILLEQGGSIPVLPSVFHLTLVHNTGIAFGLFQNRPRILLVVIFLSIILFMGFLVLQREKRVLVNMAYGFILGGAFGNLIDRMRLGYVIDFLDFRVWPVFNLADSFITIGVLLILLDTFLSRNESQGKG